MRIYYRDIILLCLIVLILLYYYIFVNIFSVSIFSYMLYMLISYIILAYYILITPIFFYFSKLTIDLFVRKNVNKNSLVEFVYNNKTSEYDIRFIGTSYYFRLDRLYSEYFYNIYQSDRFTEIISVIECIIKECDKTYGFDSHLLYERKYYIESYFVIIILGILFLMIFFL